MAFNTNRNNQGPNAEGGNWERAAAFLNIYITKRDEKGEVVSRKKLDGVPLRASKSMEASLIRRLTEDEKGLEKLKAALELDFQMVQEPTNEMELF